MRAALKLIMISTGLLLIALAVALVLLSAPLEKLLRYQVEQRLGALYKTKVTLAKLEFSPGELAVELVDLAIHNPEGFDAGEALHCSRVLLLPDVTTLLSSPVRIREVRVDGLLLNVRHEGARINIGELLAAAKARAETMEASAPATKTASASPGARKLEVDTFSSTGGRLSLSSSLVPITSASLELAAFSEELDAEAALPPRVAYLLLRSLLVKNVTFDGPFAPVFEGLRKKFLGEEAELESLNSPEGAELLVEL